MILSRIGTTLYDQLEKQGGSEFIWKGAKSAPQEDQILGHALVLSWYQAPHEFLYKPGSLAWWITPKAWCDFNELLTNYKNCMRLYNDEVIQPSLRGHWHWKIFSIWGDDFSWGDSPYGYNYLKWLSEVFSQHALEEWNWNVTFKFATV